MWIANIGADMLLNDLIRAANKAEARAKIQKSIHLDKWYPKEKQLLKMIFNAHDDQAKKAKTTPPTKASPMRFD